MLVFVAIFHIIVFITIGGPIVYVIICILDHFSKDGLFSRMGPKVLAGAALGLLLSPICILPFMPFQEPDDPTIFTLWTHYMMLMVVAGAVGALSFASLIEKAIAHEALDNHSKSGS